MPRPKSIEEEYHISNYIIVYKFLLGVIEVLLGLGIIVFGNKVLDLYLNFKSSELLEDPHDLIVTFGQSLIPIFLQYQGYIVLLLIILGLAKIVGAVGLYYKKYWGFDLLIILTFAVLPFDLAAIIKHATILKTIYFLVNLFIALYLVEFKPHLYLKGLKQRVSN